MKKLFLALALATSVGLAGCQTTTDLQTTVQILTGSYANPITKDTLYRVEAGVTVVFAGLNAYKKSCNAGLIADNCKATVAKIQTYTRKLPPLLVSLRGFVKNNDQLNAQIVYRSVVQIVNDVKTIAAASGANVGG